MSLSGELLCCKTFSEFYVWVKNLAEEVDLCSSDPVTSAETQLRIVLLMGIKDEELVQCPISLDADTSPQAFIMCCRSYKTARTTSAIHTSLSLGLKYFLPSFVTASMIPQSTLY